MKEDCRLALWVDGKFVRETGYCGKKTVLKV